MRHRISHDLTDEQAQKAARAAGDAYSAQFAKYNPSVVWSDDHHAQLQFSAKGVTLKGALTLEPGALVVDMELPFLLKPFAKKAVAVVEEHFQQWTQRAKSGEL